MAPRVKTSAAPLLLLGLAFASLNGSPEHALATDFITEDDAAPQVPIDEARFGPVRQRLHDWHVVVGAGAIYEPEYEGSDEYEISPVPYISAEFFDRLTVDPGGVSLKAYQAGPLRFDLNAGYDGGRDEKDGDALRGMGDIDGGAEVGGKATLTWGPANFFVSVDKIIGGSDGLLAKAGVAVEQPVSERFILGAEASATFADDNYMESYFGVDARQSARSGHAEYKAEAGIKSVEVGVSATWLINENWLVRGEQKVDFLLGDAADSPIVEDDIQSKSMLILWYRF